jgi:hypothetical protein
MIRNLSRGTVVAADVEWALSPQERMRGLLDRDELAEGAALVISPCNSIHMFFMKFAIDVLFLNSEGVVVRAIEDLRPWRLTRVYFSAKHTVELPLGAIAGSQTQKGDKLTLRDIDAQKEP